MHFQSGDRLLPLPDKTLHLRLTLGGLAEIAQGLDVLGSDALTDELTRLNATSARVILQALARPSGAKTQALSDADITAALPIICEVFEHAFR